MCKQLPYFFKTILVYLLSSSLIWTPALSTAAEISLQSSMSHLEMDLGSAYLRIEQIDSSMQLSPHANGSLSVNHFRAKRLILTMKNNKNKDNTATGLPNKINLPLSIVVQNALISELIIENNDEKQHFEKVAINLVANENNINIDLASANSPFGTLKLQANIVNNKPFNLNGFVDVGLSATDHPYQLHADLSGNLQTLHFLSKASLQQQNDQLALISNETNHEIIAQISAEGDIGLADNYPLAIRASIQNLKPERINKSLIGLVNFNININGQLSPNKILNITTNAYDSNINSLPLSVKSTFTLNNNQLSQIDFTAALASNTLQASGNLTAAYSTIRWQANLPDLTNLGAGFAGAIRANGLIGLLDNEPNIDYQLLAEKIQLPNKIAIEKIEGNGKISTATNGLMQSNINIVGLVKDTSPAISTHIALQGTHHQHTLNIAVKNSNLKDQKFDLTALISGGFKEANAWQGKLEKFESTQQTMAHLTQAAPIQYSEQTGFSISDLNLKVNQASLIVDSLSLGGTILNGGFKSKGRINKLALQDIPYQLFNLPENLSAHLSENVIFSGDWDIDINENINANIKLWRDAGDITLTKLDESTLQLGLQDMRANAVIVQNNFTAKTHIIGNYFGEINADITSSLSKSGHSFGFAANSPLKANLSATLKTLAWLPLPETLNDAAADGQLRLNMQANGTVSAPNLKGRLNGENLAFHLPSQGVALQNGTIDAEFTEKYLNINRIAFMGGEGSIEATGRAELANGKPNINLNWKANKFTALSRTDQFIVLNGTANTILDNKLMTINGDFKVLNGLFELPKQNLPTLGDDVIILGQEKVATEPPIKINIGAIRIDFGEKPKLLDTNTFNASNTNIAQFYNPKNTFVIRGNGLDGYLTDAISLSGAANQTLNANGSLEIRGTYLAYGQILDIETGSINFSGPINNAGLNILATR